MSTAPTRSLEQRRSALDEANRRRSMRAQRKRLWRAAPLAEAVADFLDVLEDAPSWADTWKVLEALTALPKVGAVKAASVLCAVAISPVKTLGSITPRQRRELAEALDCAKPVGRQQGSPSTYNPGPCADCGGARSHQATRCAECSIKLRQAALHCPTCGGHKQARSKTCWHCRWPNSVYHAGRR